MLWLFWLWFENDWCSQICSCTKNGFGFTTLLMMIITLHLKNNWTFCCKGFFSDLDIVWKSHVPDSVLNKLGNHQVAESIETWYVFRKHALDNILEISFDEFSAQQYLWFNKQIRSKSKQYFYYQDWFEKGIYSISDLIESMQLIPITLG